MNKQKPQSGFAHIVILTIILGIALLGTLGYVFWQNYMQPKDNVAKVSKEVAVEDKDGTNNSVAGSVEEVAGTKADWKTYTNTNYGFSFDYPSEWTTQEPSAKRVNSVATPAPSVVIQDATNDDLRVIIYPSGAGGWGIEGVYGTVNYTSKVNSSKIILSGRKYDDGADKGVGKDAYAGYYIMSSFDYDGNHYVIISTGKDVSKMSGTDEIYNQIISTWKFN